MAKVNPEDKKNESYYENLIDFFASIIELKEGADEDISQAFSEIFYENSDFIENELVMDLFNLLKSIKNSQTP